MKFIVGVGSIVAFAGVARAGTPPAIEKFLKEQDHAYKLVGKEWQWHGRNPNDEVNGCQTLLDQAKTDGVAPTLIVDVPFDTPDWKAGKHSIADLQAFCDRQKKSSAVSTLVSAISNVDDEEEAVRCIDHWEYSMTEGGVGKVIDPDKIQMPYEGIGDYLKDKATGDPFKGTLTEARKKLCDGLAKNALEARAKEEEPFRKVLKDEKLRIYLENKRRRLYGPGRVEMTTAAQFSKANVWFRISSYEDQGCKSGADHKYSVERFEFNAKQGMVSDNGKDFCGEPPKSSYK